MLETHEQALRTFSDEVDSREPTCSRAQSSDLFSVFAHSLDDFIQHLDFKCSRYADDSKIYTSSPELTLNSRLIVNNLLDTSKL